VSRFQMRIVRGCRALGYGVTSHATRDGGIAEPVRQHVRLTPRTLLALRDSEVRAVGGSPSGGGGCRYREAVYVGASRVAFSDGEDMSSLLWDLASLRDGDVDSVTVTCEGEA